MEKESIAVKKAVVIGGSNGIGLAIAIQLMQNGTHVIIIDIVEPHDISDDWSKQYTYIFCDLQFLDETLFESIAADLDIDMLVITAGLGKISDFKYFHTSEIEKCISINTTSVLKLVRIFYHRIHSEHRFYSGVMGSITGLISSPKASVYAASKAGVCRFLESVNIELEEDGIGNRILNVSPGNIKGTKFYGKENNLALLEDLANQIIMHMLKSNTLYIPQYEEIYQDVIERYYKDPHAYGISSYHYKKESGREVTKPIVKIGYLSGTFDLFHIGHLNLLKRAKVQCDYLIVGVHESGAWKGKETFIPFEERLAIVGSCKYVDRAVKSCTDDSDAWQLWHFNRLFVGSDYKGSERFRRYEDYFKDKNVEIIYFPYTQGTSSTQLRKSLLERTNEE